MHGQILANIQVSHFRLPTDPADPCDHVSAPAPASRRSAPSCKSARCTEHKPASSWLFFGDQHEATDFLFADQLKAWVASGTLSRLDTAWSRDQAQKVYVQDKMREHGAELWQWMQEGAHFYVCGDAMRMAKDVDAALREVAMTQGGMDEAGAKEWTAGMAKQGRYLRDVY